MIRILVISFLLPAFAAAQESKVLDKEIIHSKILSMDRNYAVYLPAGYESSNRSYPVLYLLHGGGVNHTGWLQQGEIQFIADKAIKEGLCTPMIIVTPDAYTLRRGYYQNKENWLYEDFFFQEFIPHVEKTYRIRNEKQFRAISGFSIGGKASFTYALHHPEIFGSSCPLSAATDRANAPREHTATPGEDKLSPYFKENNIIDLINAIPDSLKNAVRWYIDCGDDDFLFETNTLVRAAMVKAGIKNEFRVRDGAHTWAYWRSAMPAILEFISAGFRGD
ncbi:MAG: alpha/beta hydrolase-fold protein [Bacteroidota bacterium]